jgi:glycosyltransferase involved in cell wall biosynthesis
VPPGDSYALADGIQQLIEDPKQRKRLAQAGRERVEREFAVDKVATELVARFEAYSRGETVWKSDSGHVGCSLPTD